MPDAPASISVPQFHIANVATLQFLMGLERQATMTVNEKIKGLMQPETVLVDAKGQPMTDVAMRLNQKMTDYLHELTMQPTLEEDWEAAAGSTVAMEGLLTPVSFMVAYMIYMEFGQVLKRRAPQFTQVMDAVLVLAMDALRQGRHPLDVYKQTFKAQAVDEQGNVILGAEDHFQKLLADLYGGVVQFLEMKRVIVGDGSGWALTGVGERTLMHLVAVMGSTRSMRSQGQALVEAHMKAQEAMREAPEAVSALIDPNAELPEA